MVQRTTLPHKSVAEKQELPGSVIGFGFDFVQAGLLHRQFVVAVENRLVPFEDCVNGLVALGPTVLRLAQSLINEDAFPVWNHESLDAAFSHDVEQDGRAGEDLFARHHEVVDGACRAAIKPGDLAGKPGQCLRSKVGTPLGGAFPPDAALWHLPSDEKHYQQILHLLAPPYIREVFRAFRNRELTAGRAAAELGLGRARLYELYADCLRACVAHRSRSWAPRASGGDHCTPRPEAVEPLLRKLLGSAPPAGYSLAASELKRRLDFQLDPASVRRFAIAKGLAPAKPPRKTKASVRRWQCAKIDALWQLDATPHRWWPERPHLPLLNMLDDCSRRRVGARIYPAENLLAYLDFLPRAFLAHSLPLALYVDCHSFFLSSVPDALTQPFGRLRALPFDRLRP